MFLNSSPNSAPLFPLSAFLMEVSLYISKITSILLELDHYWSARRSRESATSANALWSPLSLCTRDKAYITHADGCGITSAAGTLFCSSFFKAILFVFLHDDPSAVDNAQEGPLVDDLELPSFEVFCFQLLVLSERIDLYFQDDLFRRFVPDLHLFVQLAKCLQLCLGDCDVELGLRWLLPQLLYTKGFVRLLSNSSSNKQILLYLWRGFLSSRETNQILLHAAEWVKPMTLEKVLNIRLIS